MLINNVNNIGVNPLKFVTLNPHEIPCFPSVNAHTMHYFWRMSGEYLHLDLNKGSHDLTLIFVFKYLFFFYFPAWDISGISSDSRKKSVVLDHKSHAMSDG